MNVTTVIQTAKRERERERGREREKEKEKIGGIEATCQRDQGEATHIKNSLPSVAMLPVPLKVTLPDPI